MDEGIRPQNCGLHEGQVVADGQVFVRALLLGDDVHEERVHGQAVDLGKVVGQVVKGELIGHHGQVPVHAVKMQVHDLLLQGLPVDVWNIPRAGVSVDGDGVHIAGGPVLLVIVAVQQRENPGHILGAGAQAVLIEKLLRFVGHFAIQQRLLQIVGHVHPQKLQPIAVSPLQGGGVVHDHLTGEMELPQQGAKLH